ncbi:hypothetical protein [Streptomyces sp. H51]|uniref:hypothetical protein n=1 Tax=Streptomyces sp. H51 TaxID=3111770 RepID=UPI002D7819D4|nr:hypothetical protein [Streptomyces sp. H51]
MRRSGPSSPVGDRHWRGSARLAGSCALTFCGLSLLVDRAAGSLTLPRALLRVTLSVAVGAVLLPQRVSAGPGRPAARTPCRRYVVRTDALAAARRCDGVRSCLVLRDIHGHRLELDPRILAANPLLWHEFDTGVRRSLERGTLRTGAGLLDRLGHRIDEESARAVFRESGLFTAGTSCTPPSPPTG